MKKVLKKVVTVLSVISLTTGALMGCSPKTAEPNDTTANTQNSTAEGSSAAGDTSAVTITAVIKDMSADDEVSVKFLEKVSEGVSKELGREVSIQLMPISDGTYSESMTILLQSGDIPDLIYFQNGDYQFAITQGILEDLTPYIDSSTYVKEMMQPFNEERIKNYPYLLWLSPDRIKVPVVRTDWFEGTESKTALLNDPSPENYKTFFAEMKEKYGLQAAYTVPGDLTELDTVFNLAFGIDKTWVKQDGAYVYNKVSNAQKEKLAYYAELYKEGLLDNEWLSKKWDTKESAFYDGQVGVVSGTAGAVVNIYNNKMTNQNGEAAELMVLPPAKGTAQGYTPSATSKESRGWAINAYSENKDVAFAILEYMASPEGQILDKLGYAGEHYNIVDGKYVLTDKITEWYARFHESVVTLDADISEETPYFSKPALSSLEMIAEYASFDDDFILPDEFVTTWDAGEALYAEYAADVISGKKSIDTFDDFVTEWYALGGTEITEYANKTIK